MAQFASWCLSCTTHLQQEGKMPTTELLVPNVADDSKPLSSVAGFAPGSNPLSQTALRKVSPRVKRAKWWWAVGLAAAIGIGAFLYFRGPAQPVYGTTKLDRGDIEAAITATGTVNAVKTVQVGSQVSGNILALYADFNTKVKRGQLVARIDPAIFQARVDQARAALDSAKSSVVSARASIAKAESDIAGAQANVASQKANLVRAQSAVSDAKLKNDRRVELVKQGIIAQEDGDTFKATYDQAVASLDAAQAAVVAAESSVTSARAQEDVTQTQLEAAQAQVKQATATLQQAQLDLAHTQIAAPVDGTVISRNMDVGQTVAASFQAPTIFQIAQDLTQMQVDTNVDESDVGPIRVGQGADLYGGCLSWRDFPGAGCADQAGGDQCSERGHLRRRRRGIERRPEAVSRNDGECADYQRRGRERGPVTGCGIAVSSFYGGCWFYKIGADKDWTAEWGRANAASRLRFGGRQIKAGSSEAGS